VTEEERLAREEIRDLMARYHMAGDRGELEGLVATFAEDGEMHVKRGVFVGHSDIRSYLDGSDSRALSRRADLQFVRHNLSTSVIRFETPETAVGRTYFTVISDLGLDHAGVYVDLLTRSGSVWRLRKREIRIDYAHERSHVPISRSAKE